jgi:cell wall-associated NlpC family hydrolase
VAPLHVERRSTSERDSEVLEAEPVDVLELRDGWARVRTVYGHEGWIADDALGESASEDAWRPVSSGATPLEEARRYVGARYLWGGMTEHGIDCSGLVHMAYRRAGRLVPRDADEQELAGAGVAAGDEKPGDLVTYGEDGADHATHIAFWLGDDRILDARSSAGRVLEEPEPASLRAIRRKVIRL